MSTTELSAPFIHVASPTVDEDDVKAVADVLLSGRLSAGPVATEFERRFAEYVGVEHAVTVNSGTAALHAALAAMGIQPGDEVIVPAMTFFSTATAVIHQGGVPVFCDISLDNFCMSPEDMRQRITPRTRAVIPVHYFGHAAEMDEINAIANEHDLVVIEDCAQSHSTLYKGAMTGSLGHLGAFSFFATKHMTSAEGGMVTTDNADYAGYMRSFRSHGMEGRDDHVILGYNYRISEPAAALGLSQLKRLDVFNEGRIRASEAVIERICDIPWLTVPKVPNHVKHTYFWCHIMVDEDCLGMKTQALIERLRDKGIETRNRYVEPLYRQPLLTRNVPPILRLVAGDNLPDYSAMNLPNAERAAGRVIGLPNRPDLTLFEIERIADVLHSFG